MRLSRAGGILVCTLCLSLSGSLMLPNVATAATAQAIDAGADKTIDQFKSQVKGADDLLRNAKGYLVFPEVIQAGVGIGGQYGEGVLRVGGTSASYYSVKSGSIGFQLGAQRKSIIIVFLQDQALQNFQAKAQSDREWNVGVDGSVAVLNLGAQARVDSSTINQPIVGFVFGQAGLMFNVSLEGSKVSKLER